MASPFSSLHDNRTLEITVTLPAEPFYQFVQLLESFSGFARIINRHARLARIKELRRDNAQKKQHEESLARYHTLLIVLYDKYTAQGLKRLDAIKRICKDLKAEDHPWASFDLVRPSLIEAGRPGQRGRQKKTP
ncbi:MAG: hypothetical protein RQ754_09905 [Desulfuromonadales bacterium]|nr:hypothetical protein [Desulfuromonadales bacterium]